MALTLKEALELTPGTILSFGTEHVYAVISAEPRNNGKGVYLTLRRGDGYETFATEHDLKKIVRPPEGANIPPDFGVDLIPKWKEPAPNPNANAFENSWEPVVSEYSESVRLQRESQVPLADAPETIIAPDTTAEQLEALGSDLEIQQENATIAEEESVVLPTDPAPEPPPAEVAPPKAQDGDDTAVDDKKKSKAKGKRNS